MAVLSIGVARTVSRTTDNYGRPAWQPFAVGLVPYRQRMGQLSFADVDPLADLSLRETTFVVVDLETTGGRASGEGHDSITEIGAVKVRGGAVLGELATLVIPGAASRRRSWLLRVSRRRWCAMRRESNRCSRFLEFSRGAVLVAHNAGFDIGFLRAAAERCQIAWPRPPVLCTVRLARRVPPATRPPACELDRARADCSARQPAPRPAALDDAHATRRHTALVDQADQRIPVSTPTPSYKYLSLQHNTSPTPRRSRPPPCRVAPHVYLFQGPFGTDSSCRHPQIRFLRRQREPRLQRRRARAPPHEGYGRRSPTTFDHVECTHVLKARLRRLRLLHPRTRPRTNRRSKPQHPLVVGTY